MNEKKFTFTLARLKALEATGKAYTVRDDKQQGLICKVSAIGNRSLFIQRRPKGCKKLVWVRVRNDFNMQAIREESTNIIALLNDGINPNTKTKEEDALAISLESAFEQYIQGKKLAASTLAGYRKALERMKEWKDKPLKAISKEMVLDKFNSVASDSPSSATRVAQVLRAVWKYQDDLLNGKLGGCPVGILNKQQKQWSKSKARQRRINAAAVADWFNAVRNLPNERTALYLEMLLLTGLRRRELAGLKWEDVNLTDGYMVFKNTKNHSDHCLPITKRTKELLNSRLGEDIGYVFGEIDPRRAIARIQNTTGISFSCHDLRRSFATFADKSGIGYFSIKLLLNHKSSDITADHYANVSLLDSRGTVDVESVNELRADLQKLEDYIMGLAYPSAKVVELVQ